MKSTFFVVCPLANYIKFRTALCVCVCGLFKIQKKKSKEKKALEITEVDRMDPKFHSCATCILLTKC